MITHFLD